MRPFEFPVMSILQKLNRFTLRLVSYHKCVYVPFIINYNSNVAFLQIDSLYVSPFSIIEIIDRVIILARSIAPHQDAS